MCVCAPHVHVKGRLNNSLVLWCSVVCSCVLMGAILFNIKVKNYFYIAKERREGGIVSVHRHTNTYLHMDSHC